jgi:hypothetical protein
MALAIRLEGLMQEGVAKDYADLGPPLRGSSVTI